MTAETTQQPLTALDPRLLGPDGEQALDLSLRSFGESTMLPSAAYTSTEVFAWEQRHLFAGTWTCVGRVHDLSGYQAGSPVRQRALVVGDVPVLLTFTDAGPRAFANTCRHRGHELLGEDESSTHQSVVCPYHGWSYRLDGSLRVAPEFRDAPGFEPAEHGLVELAGGGLARLAVRARGARHRRAGAAVRASTSVRWTRWSRRTPPATWCSVRGTPTRSPRTGRCSPRTTTSATTAR